MEQIGVEPKRMFLDVDVTDDAVHGEQVGGFFNGYYVRPAMRLCSSLWAASAGGKLRASNVDPAAKLYRNCNG